MATKERPILMSGPMVRALLALLKNQTRRIAKGMEGAIRVTNNPDADGPEIWHATFADGTTRDIKCPYGTIGDRLWVRETWCNFGAGGAFVGYRATDEQKICPDAIYDGWKPSIHMRRADSRITLEVVSLRVERLQDISEADAIAEGVSPNDEHPYDVNTARQAYAALWNSINGDKPDFTWHQNPFVWVVEFKVVSPTLASVCRPMPQKSGAAQA